jgi:hypothetical protein
VLALHPNTIGEGATGVDSDAKGFVAAWHAVSVDC